MPYRNLSIIAFQKQNPFGCFTIIWQRFWWWSSYWTANWSSRCHSRATQYSVNLLVVWTVTRSITQRHCDWVVYQVTIDPWVSQTLATPILWTAVKYIRKIVTRTKIETNIKHFSVNISYFLKLSCQNCQAMANWPDQFLWPCFCKIMPGHHRPIMDTRDAGFMDLWP